MKKFLLYTILFLTLCIGTATCIIVNGYTKYVQQPNNEASTEVPTDNTLTSLATNILNTENISGHILLTDNLHKTKIEGDFSYVKSPELSATIRLQGQVNSDKVNVKITLLNNTIYIDYNEQKFFVSTTDLITVFNSVLTSINSSTNSNLPKFDMAYAQTLLSEITTTQTKSGYLLEASLPNLCNVFITTDTEYTPTQILVTNISVGESIFTLNITTNNTVLPYSNLIPSEYLNISPALGYITPLINTFNQGNLCIAGKLKINETNIQLKSYILKSQTIVGEAFVNNLKIKFQIENDYIILDIYGNTFKLTIKEITTLFNKYMPNAIETTSIKDTASLINKINLHPTIKNDKITSVNASIDNITLSFEIGKTLYTPTKISADNSLNAHDLTQFIDGFKNLFADKYSLDINITHPNFELSGNAYIETNNNFSHINCFYFDGNISKIPLVILYTSTETYIKIDNNKIKLKNSSLEKVFEIILTNIDLQSTDFINTATFLDFSILQNIKLNPRTITFNNDEISVLLISYSSSYKLTATIKDFSILAQIYPNNTAYSRISNYIKKSEFKSFDEIPSLITALQNTLSKDYISMCGEIDIKILDYNYKNIKLDIMASKINNSLTVVLDNLPIDGFVTYLSNVYYSNQKCVLTFKDSHVNIHTTATIRLTNKAFTLVNKTIPLSEFSIDNLYDILSMRESIINKLKKSQTNENFTFVSNLTTEFINILDNKVILDLNTIVPNMFSCLTAEFYYDNEIRNANLYCSLSNLLNIKVMLNIK